MYLMAINIWKEIVLFSICLRWCFFLCGYVFRHCVWRLFFIITFVTVCDVRFIIIAVCDVWHESDLVIQRMPLEVWRVSFIWYLYCHVLAPRSTMRVC